MRRPQVREVTMVAAVSVAEIADGVDQFLVGDHGNVVYIDALGVGSSVTKTISISRKPTQNEQLECLLKKSSEGHLRKSGHAVSSN